MTSYEEVDGSGGEEWEFFLDIWRNGKKKWR